MSHGKDTKLQVRQVEVLLDVPEICSTGGTLGDHGRASGSGGDSLIMAEEKPAQGEGDTGRGGAGRKRVM
jgi:hypothetical protein